MKLGSYLSQFSQALFAVVALPLGDPTAWKELKFKSLPANKVSYENSALKIEVNASASPLIYSFDQIKNIRQVDVNLEIQGEMNSDQIKKWTEFEEDSYFRLGLVAKGEERPGKLKMVFAPEWVKTLFAMAPKGTGLDKIYFYNISAQKNLIGKKRLHPKSKYMHEENIVLFSPDQKQTRLLVDLPQGMDLAGFWISVDGDDSKSSFSVKIREFTYKE